MMFSINDYENVKGNIATMDIGQHSLQGKIKNLERPMMILEKYGIDYVIQGVVKRKVIFDSRPQPLKQNKN